jgi:hypothetical protein
VSPTGMQSQDVADKGAAGCCSSAGAQGTAVAVELMLSGRGCRVDRCTASSGVTLPAAGHRPGQTEAQQNVMCCRE